jgi:hypothetical protein
MGRFPYDVSKSCADLIAQAYYHSFGLPVTITRCGNLYGGGDLNFNRLIPGTIQSALRDESPIIRSDGTLSATISSSETRSTPTCNWRNACRPTASPVKHSTSGPKRP